MPINYLDRRKVQKSLRNLFQSYPGNAFILDEIERRLLAHLPYGYQASNSLHMLQEAEWLMNNELQLSYEAECFDLIIANLTPLWVRDIDELLQEVFRLLKPGGVLLLSTLGMSSFSELRTSFQFADDAKHVHAFYDMHDIGDRLVANQFAQPVMTMEQLVLTYLSMTDLITDLTQSGLRNSLVDRKKGLMTPRQWQSMVDYYHATYADGDELPLTVEIIYGYAQKPTDKLARQQTNAAGEIEVALDSILGKNL